MKSIVLLGGGPEQADAIKISKELGYNTIVLDSNPLVVGRKFADKFIQCDIANSSQVFRNIENHEEKWIFLVILVKFFIFFVKFY